MIHPPGRPPLPDPRPQLLHNGDIQLMTPDDPICQEDLARAVALLQQRHHQRAADDDRGLLRVVIRTDGPDQADSSPGKLAHHRKQLAEELLVHVRGTAAVRPPHDLANLLPDDAVEPKVLPQLRQSRRQSEGAFRGGPAQLALRVLILDGQLRRNALVDQVGERDGLTADLLKGWPSVRSE